MPDSKTIVVGSWDNNMYVIVMLYFKWMLIDIGFVNSSHKSKGSVFEGVDVGISLKRLSHGVNTELSLYKNAVINL